MHPILKTTVLALPSLVSCFAVGCSKSSSSGLVIGASAAIVTIATVPDGVSCVEIRASGGTDDDQFFAASRQT